MPIRITSQIAGYRRAGMAHPAEPTTYPADHFTAAQLKQLKAEPRLLVEEVPEEPAKKPAKKTAAANASKTAGPVDAKAASVEEGEA